MFKYLLGNFKELELYMNSGGDCDGHFGIGWWAEGCNDAPKFIYWKTALNETKC